MHLIAIGGSDAGISAALRARELDPTTDDTYPNFSIYGIATQAWSKQHTLPALQATLPAQAVTQ